LGDKAGMAARCPDCGTELPSDGAIAGLCSQCLFSLALQDSDPERALEDLPTLEGSVRILGERYQMRELLGRGGMGKVWCLRPEAARECRPPLPQGHREHGTARQR